MRKNTFTKLSKFAIIVDIKNLEVFYEKNSKV